MKTDKGPPRASSKASFLRRKALIQVEMTTEKAAGTLLEALLPETERPESLKSEVTVTKEGKCLLIQIKTVDTSTLRAALNSYLRWVGAVRDVYSSLEELEEYGN